MIRKRFTKQLAHLRNLKQAVGECVRDHTEYFFRSRTKGVFYVDFSHRGPDWLRLERLEQAVSDQPGVHSNVVYSVRILYRLKLSVCWITPIKMES